MSLIINPKIEFPFTRVFGFSASPLYILSKHSSYLGMGIGLTLGKLRDGKSVPESGK